MIVAARDFALWGIATLAVSHAALAWRAGTTPGIAFLALAYALALSAAPSVGTRLLAGLDAVGRGRMRILLGLAHAGVVLLAPLLASVAPALLPRATLMFAWLMVPTLLLAASESGALATLMNAAALVMLAALRGGAPAASGATSFLGLFAAFLVFDHWARTLAAHPRARVPPFRAVLRQAASLALPAVLAAAAVFLISPPRPAEAVLVAASRSVRAEPLGAAHRFLIFALLLGGIGILAVVRIFRRDPKGAAPSVESLDVVPLEDEALPPEPAGHGVPHSGARARVLRAYLRFLADAARHAARRHPNETPREFARRVGPPARPVQALSELFMLARYADGEPGEAQALAAEQAEDEIRAAWRRGSRR